MKVVLIAAVAATVSISSASPTFAQSPASQARPYDSLIASHAASNGVPAELVHRVIVRESRYRANAIGRGGATGLMQIKLATARGMGYTGTAAGLLDPETNLRYGVRYLAGAYRAANGHHGRSVGYYASGYYYAAKRQRMQAASAYAKTPAASAFATPGFVSADTATDATQHGGRARRQ
ncbi:transglycosylase SLT domain-containing protein [Bradyrhizobium sp. LHD-71]|uniref:transglycosylase SLT domain-containing protein n=1 Tax=Bradyrhizobium sp. LHD-71 TaxID=3072141 RepID=UPI00280C5E81|nr:transglycosylase SLT domain-containing protein [Bradyrhizobium sp. LHD-71]MDQ8727792.1 transglycosylase SLT domain-containing protein [Bradyrhizobium sp. LHD-71]